MATLDQPPHQRQRLRPHPHPPQPPLTDTWSPSQQQRQQPRTQLPLHSQLPPSPRQPGFDTDYSRGHPQGQQHQRGGHLARPTRQSSGFSSTPSLLSLGEQRPASPATTVDQSYSRYGPSHSTSHLVHPQYRHSQPHPSSHNPYAAPASRSHQSLPAQGGRQQGQQGKAQRYDSDFDRSAGGAAGSSRELFNPNGSSYPRPPPVPSSSSTSLPHPPPHQDPPSRPSSSRPHRSDRDRELREDGTGSSRRPQRSKREPVDPADLGRRVGGGHGGHGGGASGHVKGGDSKESLDSVETDFSARTKSSGAPSRRRRRRDGAEDEGEGGTGAVDGAAGASAAKSRQLFDPRKDDPMRFVPSAASVASGGGKSKGSRSMAGQSVASFDSSASDAQDYPHGNERGGADDAASVLTGVTGATTASGRKEQHPAVTQLKRAYREITDLEGKLQEEHKAAAREREREEEVESGGSGVGPRRLQGTRTRWDDDYWVRLAMKHKQLADAHYSFLQLALDPRLPASLHQLPQRYNIPTRLWQVAFHQLLERMRHAVLSSPVPSSASASDSSSSPDANVLEHLIEFIQYAYTHYSQLFEDPAVAVFRAAWIEQLGDLARYRMAVAGLASRVHAAQQSASSTGLTAAALEGVKKPRPADAASIGQAALGDWDLEEQETWKEMARDWYGQGVAENPGTGRLQHHLALLSKGDELRSLYHYVKSLTAAHPYLSARESILPLFEDEHQARRTQPDVTKAELFVHLHGMLFTKISLDDFDEVLGRFLERLKEEGWALGKAESREEFGTGPQAPFGDAQWFMLGVINIAALLQFGADDGVLKKRMAKEEEPSSRGGGGGGKHGHHHSTRNMTPAAAVAAKARAAPQAIMLKRAEEAGDETERPSGPDDFLKPLHNNASTSSSSPADYPLPFKLAQRLAFSLLTFVIRDTNPFRRVGSAVILNPYITLLLTFLSHLSTYPAAFAHLERSIPWDDLVYILNLIPSSVDIRVGETPNKLVGGRPLPEDWCIRGMDWAGRQLFGRGYWRDNQRTGGGREQHLPPPIEGIDTPAVRVESEADALRFDLAALVDGSSSASDDHDAPTFDNQPATPAAAASLAEGRWRRLALSGAWFVRHVPGLDYNPFALGGEARFQIQMPLRGKMERWAQEERVEREHEKEVERRAAERRREAERRAVAEEEGDEEESAEDEENEGDSEAVKELKARRRALKAVIRQARQTSRIAPSSGRRGGNSARLGGKAASQPKLFAGYTVLVFDTNILLTSIKLFRELIEAECWTIVVPLAVITELDGLKRNSTALGHAAVEMVDYLESAIRTHARWLKIQTSRGNYLKDLSIRNESIDFGSSPSSSSPFDLSSFSTALDPSAPFSASHDQAHSMDDVILRAVTWQSQHFNSRLALVNPRAIRAGFKVPQETATVVLVTFDRNLRLKARARGHEATDEKGLRKAVEAAPGVVASVG